MPGTLSPNSDEEPRQGHLCCGCCCSMRTAVIVVNVLGILSLLNSLRSMYYGTDGLTAEQAEAIQQYEQISLILLIVDFVFSVVGIVGAVTYNVYLLAANVVAMLVSIVVGGYISIKAFDAAIDLVEEVDEGAEDAANLFLFLTLVVAVVVTILCVYPHVGLIVEVRNGIASPNNDEISPTVPSAELKSPAEKSLVGAVHGGVASNGTYKSKEDVEESC